MIPSLDESGADEDAELEVPSKVKVSKRKYAAPTITIDTDESEPEAPKKTVQIDFANSTTFPVKPKAKVAPVPVAKVKPTAVKPSKAPAVAPSKAAVKFSRVVEPSAPAKLVAESVSEEESRASDDGADQADDSDVSDVAPNTNKFLAEVPRVITKKPRVEDEKEVEDVQMTDIQAKWATKSKAPTVLLDEDSDNDDYVCEALQKASTIKAQKGGDLSDDDMPGLKSNDNTGNDITMHEAMAKALTTIPHSCRSSVASWSSGQDLLVPDTDVDEVLSDDESGDNNIKPVVVKTKVRKVYAARQKQADLEKPQVRPATAPVGKVKGPGLAKMLAADAVNAAPRPKSSWHVSVHIIYPEPGRDIRLNDQAEEAKSTIRGGSTYLIASANKLPEAAHIKEHLMTDPKYAAILVDLLLDCINILHGSIKKIAGKVTPGFYKIVGLTLQKTKEAVEEQLKDHHYIFPSNPVTNRLKTELPFHHPVLAAVLKDGVFMGQFNAKTQHLFISTRKKHLRQLELPDAMISLAATAMCIQIYC
ncbi:hypothetical protein B0H10DRAFT_2211928 [Mycena sp. CBHHK59/15]|nr:hypothetical protein B0H10DRAFT_2211928 [Mycena sp. CBHHK59/15]